MCKMRIIAAFLAISLTTVCAAQTGDRVELAPLPNVVLVGSSVPVEMTLENTSNSDLPLFVGGWGRVRVGWRLLDSEGNDVAPKSPGNLGFRPLPESDIYRQEPGERLRFNYDLASLYMITEVGDYTLRIEEPVGGAMPPILVEAQFAAVSYNALNSIDLNGYFQPPFWGTPFAASTNASVRLSLVEAEGTPEPFHFLLIDQITVLREARSELPSFSYPVANGTIIEQAQMDFFGQIWILVRNRNKRSVLVWRINDLSWMVLIPETEEAIDFATSRARATVPAADQKIVIAGVEGREKVTSHSIGPNALSAPAPPQAETE